MKKILALVTIFALSVSGLTLAQTYETSRNKYIGEDKISVMEPTKGDLFAAGETVEVRADVEENAYLAGGEVKIYNEVGQNLLITGGGVLVDGDVEQDLMIFAGYVVVNGDIKSDLRISAGEVYINSESIKGDLLVSGAKVAVSSETVVDGEISISSENYIKNTTNNPSDLDDYKFNWYKGFDTDDSELGETLGVLSGVSAFALLLFKLVMFAGSIIAAYVVLKLFPVFAEKTIKEMEANPIKGIMVGLIAFTLGFGLAILLVISVIGWKLLLVLGLIATLALYLSNVYATYTIGRTILKKAGQKKTGRLLAYFVGVLVVEIPLFIINLVPIVGWIATTLIRTLISSWGVGAMITNKYRSFRV